MPAVHRQDDLTTGHSCSEGGYAPPTTPASFSPDVFVDGKAVVRNGDEITPHQCAGSNHSGVYMGSHTVFVNNQPVQIVGDPISCGDTVAQGSPDVFVEG